MYTIIITGASGLIATELALSLLRSKEVHLFLISEHPEKVKERYKNYGELVSVYSIDTFEEYSRYCNEKFHFCIHTAFARSKSGQDLVESLQYLRKIADISRNLAVGAFVNISSQSVYGNISEPAPWKESAPQSPDNLYAMAKSSSEIITSLAFSGSHTRWTNIRLCSVMENARFVNVFVNNALKGLPILLTSPHQKCSFIDIRDVVNALKKLISSNVKEYASVYNLGSDIVCTIKDVAYLVKEIGEKKFGLRNITITECQSDIHNNIGMDTSLFKTTFNWMPDYNMNDMVTQMFEFSLSCSQNVPTSFSI